VSQNGRARKPGRWVLAGVVFIAVGVGFWLVFVVVPHRMVPACKVTNQPSQLSGGCCLTTEQRLQAENNVRTAGVQALGGLVVLAAAGVAASVTWRGFRETRRMALEERHQTRLAEAYVPLVRAVIATDTDLQLLVLQTAPRPPGVPEADADLQEIGAKVDAFGSTQVRDKFNAYLKEARSIRNQFDSWTRAEEARGAGKEPAPEDRNAERPSVNTLIDQLSPAVRGQARAELRGETEGEAPGA
jgi:hypothetical protein